jgi:septum formation protein
MRNKKWRLILASQSPRRRDILESAGFSCMTFTSNSSESFDENLTLEENLCHIAEAKVQAVADSLTPQKLKGSLILGADTVVVLKDRIFGKPKNSAEARRMLRALSGKTHCVKTSFSIFCPDQVRGVTRVITTRVGFRKLSPEEMKWYVDTGEPFDKAGGYGIQGLASHFVNFVDGDFLNVVGLPLFAVIQELKRQGWGLGGGTHASKSSRKNKRR